MATNRPVSEQIAEVDKKIEQLKARKKAMLARENAAARKARNHRLIEIGAEVEAALGYALDDEGMRKALGDFLRKQNANGEWANKAIQAGRTPQKIEE